MAKNTAVLPQDTTCQALFTYLPIDGNTIEVFNLSLGNYQETTLEMGDGTSYTNPDFPLTHNYTSPGLYQVCLTIQDSLSCFSELCLPLFTLPQDIICEEADCVLPGDTDKDGKINIFDALPIGLGFNLEGYPRPNASIDAMLQVAIDWLTSFIEGLDSKHIDCDGNGIINEADFLAIDQNYQRVEKNDALVVDSEKPVVTLAFASDTLFLENATSDTLTIPATLSIGEETMPLEDFYGIALSFDYQGMLIEDISTQLLPNPSLSEETVFQEDKIFEGDQYGVAITNNQQLGSIVQGPVAEVGFVIIGDLIVARTIHIDINDVKVINSKGQELPVSIQDDALSLTIISAENRSVTTNTHQLLDAHISIAPNPATDYLQINLEGPLKNRTGQVRIYNSIGERLLTQYSLVDRTSVDISELPIGIYWVELLLEEGRISKKVIKGY